MATFRLAGFNWLFGFSHALALCLQPRSDTGVKTHQPPISIWKQQLGASKPWTLIQSNQVYKLPLYNYSGHTKYIVYSHSSEDKHGLDKKTGTGYPVGRDNLSCVQTEQDVLLHTFPATLSIFNFCSRWTEAAAFPVSYPEFIRFSKSFDQVWFLTWWGSKHVSYPSPNRWVRKELLLGEILGLRIPVFPSTSPAISDKADLHLYSGSMERTSKWLE